MGESRKSTTAEEQDLHKGGDAKRRGHQAKCHKFMTFWEWSTKKEELVGIT